MCHALKVGPSMGPRWWCGGMLGVVTTIIMPLKHPLVVRPSCGLHTRVVP